MISDEEAAQILIMMSQSQPPSKKQNIVEAIEKKDRLSFRVPRQKRRDFPITSSSSSSSSTQKLEYVDKQDPNAHIHDGPLMISPTKSIENRKKRSPMLPPVDKQPVTVERKTYHPLAAETSSSGTRKSTPEWLSELMTSKNGTEPKKIIVKDLTASDVSISHNRLSMPFSNIIDMDFLSPAEERIIEEDDNKTRKTGVEAKLVCKLVGSADPKEFKMSLRKWKMSKSSGRHTWVYNLVKEWYQVVKGCSLQMDDKICLWSFRSDGKLFFALGRSSDSKEMSSALVIYDESNDVLPSK